MARFATNIKNHFTCLDAALAIDRNVRLMTRFEDQFVVVVIELQTPLTDVGNISTKFN